jgi:four helix bundle protein
MQRFTDLRVWQRSHAIAVRVYRLTRCFPDEERYGLVSQLRRAAVSVPANIAEGSKREPPLEYSRFLNISESSASESQALLLLARDLEFIAQDVADTLFAEYDEIAKMLNALRSKLERPPRPSSVKRARRTTTMRVPD